MRTSLAGPTSLLIDRAKSLCLNDTQEGRVRLLLTLLVQLVERRFPKPDVVGSSPTRRENVSFFYFLKKKSSLVVFYFS